MMDPMLPLAPAGERVAAGMDYLDDHAPGWLWQVDLDTLDVDCVADCPLAQVFGSFWGSPLLAGLPAPSHPEHTIVHATEMFDRCLELGFVSFDEPDLTGLWQAAITARRSAARGDLRAHAAALVVS